MAARYVAFFETLDPPALARLGEVFAPDARFRDPFNEARGPQAIRRVFEHMFATCVEPRFMVSECVGEGALYYLRWQFSFGAPGARRTIDGVSRVRFDPTGRAVEHDDFWDPARQLYEQVPLLGLLCRALRRRLGAGTPADPPQSTKQTSTRGPTP